MLGTNLALNVAKQEPQCASDVPSLSPAKLTTGYFWQAPAYVPRRFEPAWRCGSAPWQEDAAKISFRDGGGGGLGGGGGGGANGTRWGTEVLSCPAASPIEAGPKEAKKSMAKPCPTQRRRTFQTCWRCAKAGPGEVCAPEGGSDVVQLLKVLLCSRLRMSLGGGAVEAEPWNQV